MTSEPDRPSPIEVVEQEAVAHGLRFTRDSGLAFLLGFLIGRDWNEQQLRDEDKLREWLRRYFAATGRKPRRRRPSRPVA